MAERRRSPVGSDILDRLRGLAAVYVVINHARAILFAGGAAAMQGGDVGLLDYLAIALLQLTSFGHEAVILFFVLSGFSMAHSIQNGQSTTSFLKKRAIRVWLPYLAACGVVLIVAAYVFAVAPDSVRLECARTKGLAEWIGFAFYLQNCGSLAAPFWSLPHEVLFYLMCPVLLATRRSALASLAVAAVMMVVGALLMGISFETYSQFAFNFACRFLPILLAGAATYHFFDHLPRLGKFTWPALAIASVGLAWGTNKVLGLGDNLVADLGIAITTILLLRSDCLDFVKRIPNWGEFSYSIYLFHWPFIIVVAATLEAYGLPQSELTSYWAWTLVVPPALFVSWLLYLVSERPCNAWLRRIREGGERQPAPAI